MNKLLGRGDPIPPGGCGCRENGVPIMQANCKMHQNLPTRSNDLSVYKKAIQHQDKLHQKFMDFCRDNDVAPKGQDEWDLLWRVYQKGAEAQRTLQDVPRVSEGLAGYCVVQLTRALINAASGGSERAAKAQQAIGQSVAVAVTVSPYQPCATAKIEIVGPVS